MTAAPDASQQVDSLAAEELAELNRSPIGYLAAIGVEHGVTGYQACSRAMELIDRYGSSRRIDGPAGGAMCRAMRDWALSGRASQS